MTFSAGQGCWRWATARVRGELHERMHQPLQDACAVACHDDALLAAVADGAGSTRLGGKGAALLMRHLRRRFREASLGNLDGRVLWEWVLEANEMLQGAARKKGCAPDEFSTTLAVVIALPDKLITAQVGDSSVAVRSESGEWEILCWPKNGEYSNITFFLPLRSMEHLHVRDYPHMRNCNSLAVFSDGIADLCMSDEDVSSAFFEFWLQPLLKSDRCGLHHDISLAMRDRLRTDQRIRERLQSTGDDRTLVMATRASCQSAIQPRESA